jgi:epoxyqueuosine reductase
MELRIYGCDVCQEACPINKKAECGGIPSFNWESGLGGNPLLLPLINISADDFKSHIVPTTAGWIRRTRFRRNAIVAAGNAGDTEAVPYLFVSLQDSEPVIRGHAAWALGKIGGQNVSSTLEKALYTEEDDDVISEIKSALDRLSSGL